MRNALRKLLAVGLLGSVVGCGASSETAAPASNVRPAYFALKPYLDAQAALLNQRRPAVEKRVVLRDGSPETVRVPQVDWTKELQVFYQADINKPALRGVYTVDSTTTTDGTHRYAYTRKPGFDNAVALLAVTKDASGIREVAATLQQDNPLFYSEKKLVLQAATGSLVAYQVRGVQKLILFDTLRYATAARVAN